MPPPTGQADLVPQLSWPLRRRVICQLIGLPLADAEQVRAWTDDLARLTSFGATADEQRAAAHGSVAFERYLADQIDQRRHAGRDDLLTALVTAPADGTTALRTAEVISLLTTLVFAGHETTANLIGNAVLLLLHHPDLWAAAAGDPQLVDAVIEETRRIDAPVQGMFRMAVADTELAGVTIPAGAQVFALIGSANQDPDTFADPHRGGARPAPVLRPRHPLRRRLARAEAATAITTLTRRLPTCSSRPFRGDLHGLAGTGGTPAGPAGDHGPAGTLRLVSHTTAGPHAAAADLPDRSHAATATNGSARRRRGRSDRPVALMVGDTPMAGDRRADRAARVPRPRTGVALPVQHRRGHRRQRVQLVLAQPVRLHHQPTRPAMIVIRGQRPRRELRRQILLRPLPRRPRPRHLPQHRPPPH